MLKKLGWKKILLCIILPVLCVGILSTSLAVFLPKDIEKANQKEETSKQVVAEDVEIVGERAWADEGEYAQKGGSIYLGPNTHFTMENGTISGSKARFGGAIYVDSGATFIMDGGEILGNEAVYGGAIYVANGANCYINGGTISANTSQDGLGIYVEEGGHLEIGENAVVSDNITRRYETTINVYVGENLRRIIYTTQESFTITEDNMPLTYENCCGYFLDDDYIDFTDDAIDLTQRTALNLYTKESTNDVLYFNEYSYLYIFGSGYTFEGENEYVVGANVSDTSYEGEVVFPREYNNEEIKLVSDYSSSGYFSSVVLSNSIVSISSYGIQSNNLQSINIHNGIVQIGGYNFCYDTYSEQAFKNLRISKSVLFIDSYAMTNCVALEQMEVDADNPIFDSRDNCNALIITATDTLTVGSSNTIIPSSVKIIGDAAFKYKLKYTYGTFVIPEGVEEIGVYAFEEAGRDSGYDENGNYFTLDFNLPSTLEKIGNFAFYGCQNSFYEDIILPESLTEIGDGAFNNCGLNFYENKKLVCNNNLLKIGSSAFSGTNLTEIHLNEGLQAIGDSAFHNTDISSVNIPASVKSIGGAILRDCSSLTTITVDENNTVYDSRNNCNAIMKTATDELIQGSINTVIPDDTLILGSYAFWYIPITEITLPEGLLTIKGNAIYGTQITELIIPSTVNSLLSFSFGTNNNLTSIVIPENITELPENVLFNCKKLEAVILPDTLTQIDRNAFGSCSALTSIFIPKSVATIVAASYYNSPFYNCSSSLVIYCESTEEDIANLSWGSYWNYRGSSAICTTKYGYTRAQYEAEVGLSQASEFSYGEVQEESPVENLEIGEFILSKRYA